MPFAEEISEHATLVDLLLAEQRDLSAVERFSKLHERGLHSAPAMEGHYRALLPASPPGEGEQYAFSVDLDACSGCKGCVSACASLNGLDRAEEETWRSVGLLHGEGPGGPFQQTITTACHHCVEPGCLEGCPVLAYEKDARTGIVRHLDDQCIGCQYCILKCPYDVPKYSPRRGIVRKCDMCSSRLTAGEAPACVQACPNEAITITVVRKGDIAAAAVRGEFLAGTPDPALTLPTTRYRSMRTLPSQLRPADAHRLRPDHGHPPLVTMLVLTQASVGLFVAELGFRNFNPTFDTIHPPVVVLAACLGLAGIGTSGLHLGRPLGAWRAFLGLKTSWLSREIVAFGLFGSIAFLHAGLVLLHRLMEGRLPSAVVDGFFRTVSSLFGTDAMIGTINGLSHAAQVTVGLPAMTAPAAVAAGLLAAWTSVMIYADTGRPSWRLPLTAFRFGGTVALLGVAGALACLYPVGASHRFHHAVLALLMALTAAKLGGEMALFVRPALAAAEGADADDPAPAWTPMRRTGLLLLGPLFNLLRTRVTLAVAGGLVLPFLLWTADPAPATASSTAALAALLLLAGEFLERHLFFASSSPDRMPGHFETE